MAAVTIAVAKHETGNRSGDAKGEDHSLDNMRSKIPPKENRDAELYLRVLVLG